MRRQHPSLDIRETDSILPQYIVQQVCQTTDGKATIVTGVGQHQMWGAHHYCYNEPNTLITSGGLGTMGFGLPAAIGAQVGRPNSTVWLLDGDGSFQMTLQELATIAQENLPVKIAILNNGYLGMVRQWQELFYERRYVATPLTGPDFVKLAAAYGIPGADIKRKDEVIPAIEKAMATDGPFLINFHVEPEENVYPMVPQGGSLVELLEEPKMEESKWPQRSTH